MKRLYKLEPILDIREYEGFGSVDSNASVRGTGHVIFDFSPDSIEDRNWQVPRLSKLWKPHPVTGKVRPWNDYPCLNLEIPAFSRRAVDALRDLLEPHGELLPLVSSVGEYYAFNVTTIADVLDHERSEIDWTGEGRILASTVKRFELLPNADCPPICHLVELMTEVFVTDIFVERIAEHRLNGFNAIPVWPLAPGEDWWELEKARQRRREQKARQWRRKTGGKVDEPPLEPLE